METVSIRAPKKTASGHYYYPLPALETYRERAGLSRQQLADRAGITRITVYFIETGKHAASVDTIYKLAEALDESPFNLVLLPPEEEGESEET